MKLDDFLKPKKVRCIIGSSSSCNSCLTAGKLYDVIGATYGRLKIQNDNRGCSWHDMDCFEPVPDQAENPLQDIELTPEFEVVEPVLADNSVNTQDNSVNIQDTPKFKVGDKVYFGTFGEVKTVSEVGRDNDLELNGEIGWVSGDCCCHATQENYERLQATFTDIEFEQPPKELKGSDLCRAMLDSGWKYVPCYVHDGSDDEAINRKHYVSVKNETPRSGYNFSGTGANDWKYAVPIDPRTGEPLTQAAADE